ncbi:ACT domain-containing protein [Drosera capensis]
MHPHYRNHSQLNIPDRFSIPFDVDYRIATTMAPVGGGGMVNANDDAVLVQRGRTPREPCVVTVNCTDKTGLGCDICWTILDFGLLIVKGDVSTDGKWCYVVLWVVPHDCSSRVQWTNLKERLVSLCPPCPMPFFYDSPTKRPSHLFLLKFCCLDRRGLLHDVTQVLVVLELKIESVKVTTTPDGRVLDLFFIRDNVLGVSPGFQSRLNLFLSQNNVATELLHTKERQLETRQRLQSVLGESCTSCELQLADSHCESHHGVSSVSPTAAEELFRSHYSETEHHMQALSPDMTRLKKASVNIDNTMSPSHTLLQIHCVDHKGLLYDIMRTLKDQDIQVIVHVTCLCHFPLVWTPESITFSSGSHGRKIVDPEKESTLSSHLKMEMLHPLRVMITSRGPDTELLVANPVELCGHGRPRVFYDITRALKALSICIFSAEIGRHTESDREWEVYRFLLDENCEYQLLSVASRNQIVDKVRRTLMGW